MRPSERCSTVELGSNEEYNGPLFKLLADELRRDPHLAGVDDDRAVGNTLQTRHRHCPRKNSKEDGNSKSESKELNSASLLEDEPYP